MKKRLTVILCTILILSMTSTALAYPTQGVSSTVSKPEGRDYFPSDISELPVVEGLNDLFEFLDPSLGTNGRVETPEDWEARRAEIADLVQYYYLGYKQPTSPDNIVAIKYQKIKPGNWWTGVAEEREETAEPFLGEGEWGGAMILTIKNPETGVTADLTINGIYVPKYTENAELQPGETNIKGPYPVVLGVGGGISAAQRDEVLKRGYAMANLVTATAYTDTTWSTAEDADNSAYRTGAYTTLYPFSTTEYEYNSGALMGWAWGISCIIDALENGVYDGMLDPTRTVVTGNSRNGKAALIAAAFDERISIAAPCDPGQTGTASYRYTNQAQLFNYQTPNAMERVYARNEKPTNVLTDSEAHWVSTKAEDFRYNVDSLPFDAHSVEAMIAPRPLITFTGEEFDWLGSPSTVLTISAAKEVYEFLGAGDDIAVRVHDGAHALQNRDVAYLLAIMDREFRNGGEGDLIVEDVWPELDPPTNGAGTYKAVADFTVSPYEIDSSYVQWSRPGKDVLWVEDELITAGLPAAIKAHTDAPSVKITLPDGTVRTAEAVDGVATLALAADETQVGRYAVTSAGGKDAKTVYFQGMSISNALRHGITSNNAGGPDHPVYGFTSRVNEDLEVYADGVKLETSLHEGVGQAQVMDFGAKVEAAVETYNVMTLKNMKLAAMPGYTFEISFDKALYNATEPAGSATDDARERPSWRSDDTTISAAPAWPVIPNNLADDGVRAPKPATPTAFDTVITVAPMAAGEKAFTINFSEPVNKNEFGFGCDFAAAWETAWNEDATSVTITIEGDVAAGQACALYVFRLRDMEGNMIGQNGIAGPIDLSFTVK